MDEIDEVWEIEFFGAYSYWVTKETYEEIKSYLLDITIDKGQRGIAFKTIHGAEYVILLSNISDICYSTKAIRTEARQTKKEYKKEWEEKPEWEE